MSKMPPEPAHSADEIGDVALELSEHQALQGRRVAPSAPAATASETYGSQSPRRV
jgi:hypothetical protein